jgi:hypothetical protein
VQGHVALVPEVAVSTVAFLGPFRLRTEEHPNRVVLYAGADRT